MCWQTYKKTLLYKCPCSLSRNFTPPRILRTYTRNELSVLLSPDQKIGYHYYKPLFGEYIIEKEIYCNSCKLFEQTKDWKTKF
jgi:hypothetical protein